MLHRHLLTVATAFGIALTQPAWAYGGLPDQGVRFEMDGALPLTTRLDTTPPAVATESPPSVPRGVEPSPHARNPPARMPEHGDAFQRYFDRHYRAHLVLDATTNRQADIE